MVLAREGHRRTRTTGQTGEAVTLHCPSGHPVAEHDAFCGQCGVAISGSAHAEPLVYAAARSAGSATRRTRTLLLVAITLTVAATAAALWFAQRENDSTHDVAVVAPTPDALPPVDTREYTRLAVAHLCNQDATAAKDLPTQPNPQVDQFAFRWPGMLGVALHLTAPVAEQTLGWQWQVGCGGTVAGRYSAASWATVLDVAAPTKSSTFGPGVN